MHNFLMPMLGLFRAIIYISSRIIHTKNIDLNLKNMVVPESKYIVWIIPVQNEKYACVPFPIQQIQSLVHKNGALI